MDIRTRGVIENQIDAVYQKQNMLENLDWIFEADRQLKSFGDFALGYFLGSLMQIASYKAEALKHAKKFKIRYEKFKKELEKNPKKRMRTVTAELTREETDEIRDIMKKWIGPFREKLNREIAVRKIGK